MSGIIGQGKIIFEEVLNEAKIKIVEKLVREIMLPRDIRRNERFNVP